VFNLRRKSHHPDPWQDLTFGTSCLGIPSTLMAKRGEEDDSAGQGLQSRKRARIRRELTATALALFEANGYEETTVEEIAAAVDVSPRTFFRYFGAKEDVLFDSEEDQAAELRRLIRDCPIAATDMSALEQVMLTFANYLAQEHQSLLARAVVVAENPRLVERSLRVLSSWELTLADELAAQAGMEGPDLNLQVLAASCMGALNVAGRQWRASDGRCSLMTVAQRALALATRSPGGRSPGR
jgi:AcrR family transcriptional regulator